MDNTFLNQNSTIPGKVIFLTISVLVAGLLTVPISSVAAQGTVRVLFPARITTTYTLGSTHNDIKAAQILLNQTLCPVTTASANAGSQTRETEYFGGQTKQAVECFQRFIGQAVTGSITPALYSALLSAVQNGTASPQVQLIQNQQPLPQERQAAPESAPTLTAPQLPLAPILPDLKPAVTPQVKVVEKAPEEYREPTPVRTFQQTTPPSVNITAPQMPQIQNTVQNTAPVFPFEPVPFVFAPTPVSPTAPVPPQPRAQKRQQYQYQYQEQEQKEEKEPAAPTFFEQTQSNPPRVIGNTTQQNVVYLKVPTGVYSSSATTPMPSQTATQFTPQLQLLFGQTEYEANDSFTPTPPTVPVVAPAPQPVEQEEPKSEPEPESEPELPIAPTLPESPVSIPKAPTLPIPPQVTDTPQPENTVFIEVPVRAYSQ